MDNKHDSMNRREFLRVVGAGVAGAALVSACRASSTTAGLPAQVSRAAIGQAAEKPIRAAVVRHSSMMADETTPNREAVLLALDAAVKHVFGEDDARKAWEKVCATDDVVAIKVNCISGLIFSHPVVAMAIAQRLMDIGVPAENIIIWDRSNGELARAGYTINTGGQGVRCYGTPAYDEWIEHRGIRTRLSKIITQTASAIINLAVLKDHGSSGVTLTMKNHYGSIANPGDLHGNDCDPGIPYLNDIPAIRDKTRLCVIDATRGNYRNGPGGRPDAIWAEQALIVSANPVAADALGLEILDRKRAQVGLGSLAQKAHHIATAAQIGLGPNERSKMNVLETAVG
ncbi:MAG: DUF362 domain-containing protein [Armatimonadetes bacterium]|nr:DUF362 domain-containing protein [Armatimonadota bacterium]